MAQPKREKVGGRIIIKEEINDRKRREREKERERKRGKERKRGMREKAEDNEEE